jgi:hypothetical protein
LIAQRAFTGDLFKIFMKAGEIIKAAFITDLLYVHLVVDKQLTGAAYPYFVNKARVGFFAARFKEFAERIRADVGHRGYLFQSDLLFKIYDGVIVNGVDAVLLRFLEIVRETQ